jgi:hypothetical protein
VAGTGYFTISGAITNKGRVTDYRTVDGNKVLIRRVAVGKNGTITFLITLYFFVEPGHWKITSATGSYEGLRGTGVQTVDDYESTPATFTLGAPYRTDGLGRRGSKPHRYACTILGVDQKTAGARHRASAAENGPLSAVPPTAASRPTDPLGFPDSIISAVAGVGLRRLSDAGDDQARASV